MPDRLGGMHMANLVTKPYVIEFLEMINGVGETTLLLEEIEFSQFKSEYQNSTIREMAIRRQTGATIIAFKDETEGFIFNPPGESKMTNGDILIILGTQEHLTNFRHSFLN